jgi:hypothetical protein
MINVSFYHFLSCNCGFVFCHEFFEKFDGGGEINKVHAKTIKKNPKRTFHSKVMTRNLLLAKNGQLLSLPGTRKKAFLSTSNVLISQSVRSTFVKLFAHVLLVV